MKKYGIYLAYPPTVDLRTEGLGRHLAEFLKAAQDRGDVRFVIACPSWMHKNLSELFDAKGIRFDSFEFLSPAAKPLALVLYERYVIFKARPRSVGRLKFFKSLLQEEYADFVKWMERRIAAIRSLTHVLLLGALALPLLAIAGLLAVLFGIVLLPLHLASAGLRALQPGQIMSRPLSARLLTMLKRPKDDLAAVRWYGLMLEAEVALLHDMINGREDISAWYSPTAFWPHFHQIKTPRLMCVPDVVLADFPVGFAPLGGERRLDAFREVEQSIRDGEFFVTYSQEIKWGTLVNRYHVRPTAIDVVPHGANRLDELVMVSGFPDNEAATDTLCRNVFRGALSKALGTANAENYGSSDVRFLFYASQFRPNKNIISLLRAYEYLLKRRYISHKLVLTGNPGELPEAARFIADHNLSKDVLCLFALSAQELAACYRLADLAVNPSLSEGGCPFTFCEALSVGTPVVMARIPVTEEVITDPDLQALMFFDPYEWMDMAVRIEWALQNLDFLHENQAPFYAKLAQRTWRNVVDEHVKILDRISSPDNMSDFNRRSVTAPQSGGGHESTDAKY